MLTNNRVNLMQRLTSSTDINDGDSQVRPFMPERDASEKHLTSTMSSLNASHEKMRSNNASNNDNTTMKTDEKSRVSLHTYHGTAGHYRQTGDLC